MPYFFVFSNLLLTHVIIGLSGVAILYAHMRDVSFVHVLFCMVLHVIPANC